MTKQYLKQYQLGQELFAVTKDPNEMYSSGVGAANHAIQLARRGKIREAQKWAKRAVSSWEIYHRDNPNYYNSYVHLALAFGILGELDKMNEALNHSGKLCGKDQSYSEFVWVREQVGFLKRTIISMG